MPIKEYVHAIKHMIPQEPVVLVDDTDIIKPYGKKFEALGRVRDGSAKDNTCENGYLATELVVLSKQGQPLSLFSHIHSSKEEGYSSSNTVTYEGIFQAVSLLGRKATYVFDRGFDQNKIFLIMDRLDQNYIIRLKGNRKIWTKGRWLSAGAIGSSHKGKIMTEVMFQGEKKAVYLSPVYGQITASKKKMNVILVYGIGETPMMLATNRKMQGKDDVIQVLRTYLSRWRIEEYFRFKKEEFGFENMRVRNLRSMNRLNRLLTYAIAFLALVAHKSPSHALKNSVMEKAAPLRKTVLFFYYQMAKGLRNILAYAKTGIKNYYKPLRKRETQISFRFLC